MKNKAKNKLYKKLVVGGYGTSTEAQDAFDNADQINTKRTSTNSNITGVGSKVASAFGPIGMVVGAGLTMGSKLEEGDTKGGLVASSILSPNIAKMGHYNRDTIKKDGVGKGFAKSILNYSTSGITGKLEDKKNREMLEAEAGREVIANNAVNNYQNLIAEGYDPKGTTKDLYKNGGKLYKKLNSGGTVGGDINPLSKENAIVEGRTHEDGGVKLPKLGVELEDNETINKGFVFSDKLGFADKHKSIAKVLGKLEKKPQTQEVKNTIKILKDKEEALKVNQEATKQALGIENDLGQMKNGGSIYKKLVTGGYGRGGDYYEQKQASEKAYGEAYAKHMAKELAMEEYASARSRDAKESAMQNYASARMDNTKGFPGYTGGNNQVTGVTGSMSIPSDKPEKSNPLTRENVNSVLAYSDNIANVILNSSKRNKKIPEREGSNFINPVKYDLSADKIEATNQLRGFNKAIDRSNTNQGVINANRAAGLAKTIGIKNKIIQDERNLNNQEVARTRQMNNAIDTQNKAIRFDNKMLKLKAQDDLINESSANIANATNKHMWYERDKNLQQLAKEQQLVNAASYDEDNREWLMKEKAKLTARKKANGGKLHKRLV